MNPTNERTLRRLLKLPPSKWAKASAKLSMPDQMAIAKAMENDAERLVLLSEYLRSLSYGAAHETAQKLASRKLKRVRKALGYTYPEQGLSEASW